MCPAACLYDGLYRESHPRRHPGIGGSHPRREVRIDNRPIRWRLLAVQLDLPSQKTRSTAEDTMSSIVDQLRGNDPSLKEIRLTEVPSAYGASIYDIIDALEVNTTIEFIRLDRDFLPGMEPEHSIAFFTALGKVSSLKEASIWHCTIPVTALSEFLSGARGLQILQLGCLDLEGNVDDFQAVAESLKEHPGLKSFTMSDFSLNDDTISIDGLIETLATVPNLERVKLEVTYQKRRSLVGNAAAEKKVKVALTGKSLAKLILSKSLVDLHLSRLNLDLTDFTDFATALKSSPSLKTLATPHCGLNDQGAVPMALAIGESKTLESVDLSCNKLSDEGCISIATALKGNSSVKFLRLWGNVKISNAGFDALVDMLEHNCVLERVPLMAPNDYQDRLEGKLLRNRQTANQAA